MKIGQRRSKQRELILEELKALTCHPTADELYEIVRKRLTNISLGTVYRNLDLMASSGIILKIDSGGKNRFDGNAIPHPHLRCIECGKVDDIMFDVSLPIPSELEANGYEITGCTIEYYGICPNCKTCC
ncbi:Fur family transcriptional regulator [Maridesulfovibrio frigidus]|uniref:Fur family transcriptional regulator n=1 Tax=Maridesulfovibrio frigidus TaxID=340956 RepID=UPI0004E1E935|nr:transcriptional repressor [Maridesulfovibrio frigidus]